MSIVTRRGFVGLSAAAVSVLRFSPQAVAQTVCNTSGLPNFSPNRLTVDCASKRNFLLFRRNPDYLGLAGVVSMTFVQGKFGNYSAGNLTLFPWLKPAGVALGAAKVWGATFPSGPTQYLPANPIPGWTTPLDEYYCRLVAQVPWKSFIGFRVDTPFDTLQASRPWYTNVPKLTDGKGVGIGWTSCNLNAPWFGGSTWIPSDATCKGSTWHTLIIDALNQASVGIC